jgi:hypothetical protein
MRALPDDASVIDEESLQQAMAGNLVKMSEFVRTDRRTNLFARASQDAVVGGCTGLGHSH